MEQDILRLQTVGGNTALALLLTVSSNLLGIFTMPFLLCQMLGASGSAVTMKPGPLLLNLLKTILVPLLGGASIRAASPGQSCCLSKPALSCPVHVCCSFGKPAYSMTPSYDSAHVA